MHTQVPALLIVLAVCGGAAASDLYRVPLPRAGDLRRVQAGGFDILEVHREAPEAAHPAVAAADVLIRGDDPDELERLRGLGFDPRLLIEDLEQAYASGLEPLSGALGGGPPNFGQGSMGGYYTFSEIVATIDHYVANYPNIVSQKLPLGNSHEGRPIWAFKISDNPNQTENEPRVLFDALQHAREPMSAHTLLWLVDHLAVQYGSDPDVTQLVNEREIWFVPCMNPDGYRYNQQTNPNGGGMWRKNRRPAGCPGVDLNRNWPTFWGYDNSGSSGDPCSSVYRGPAAGSEPETAALNAFMNGKNFRTAWSMHTYGEWLVEPYGYRSASPGPVYNEYSIDMAAFNGYTHGVAHDLLYPANGISIDHYNDVYGTIAFTPEIGESFWPPVSQMVSTAELNLEPGLLMIKYAGSWIIDTGLTLTEISGAGNGHADPGEDLELVLEVRNKGQLATAAPIQLTLTSGDPMVTILTGSASIPALGSRQDGDNAASPLVLRIDPAATAGVTVDLGLTVAVDGLSRTLQVPLQIGSPRVILRDLLESELGFSAGVPGDTATTGLWERVDPNPVVTGGTVTQPGDDATVGGTQCYVTGNNNSSLGSDDVDSGHTTLMTPLFDLTGLVSPVVRYQRHYYNDDGDDPFTIQISNDDGQSWTLLETVMGLQNSWTEREFALDGLIAASDRMRVRFIAEDDPNNSITEAAIDDFEILDFGRLPHTGVFGAVTIGQTFEIQLAGTPGRAVHLLASFGTGSASLPGVAGTFGLDPDAFYYVLASSFPADGLFRVPLTLADNPNLIGLDAYFQIVGDVPPLTFSNVAAIQIQ